MKKIYFLVLFGAIAFSSNAQSLSKNFNQEISELQFLCSDIQEISLSSSGMSSMLPGGGRIEQQKTGFYGMLSGGGTLAFLAKDSGAVLAGAEFVAGYRWSLYSGVGAGIGFYKDMNDLHTTLPIFIEVRNHFMRNRFSPFSVISAGYSIPNGRVSNYRSLQSGVVKGGPMVGITLGVRYLFTKRTGINLFVGYMGQKETIEEHILIPSVGETASREVPYFLHQAKFGIGISF